MYEQFEESGIREKISQLKQENRIGDDLAAQLLAAIDVADRRNQELVALMQGSRAVMEQKAFKDTARSIFDYCKDLIGATSGYVALLSETGEENEVLFLEAGGLTCTVNPELPMPIRGMRAQAYEENRAIYDNDFMHSEWVEFLPKGHVTLKNVLFAPLIFHDTTVGLIGLANKSTDFDEKDAKIATSFGSLAAVALQNSHNIDEREKTERSLQEAMKRLHLAMESAEQGVWEWNFETGLVTFDEIALKMLDYESDLQPVKGEWWIEQIHPDDRRQVEKALNRYLSGESKRYNTEFRLRRKDGRFIWVASSARVIRYDQKGNPLLVVGTHRDVTKQKREENILKETKDRLENVNMGLQVLIEHREQEMRRLEENVVENANKLIAPYIDKMDKERMSGRNRAYLELIAANLDQLVSPLARNLTSEMANLTPGQIQIADLVRKGKTTKEIAAALNISANAVSVQRFKIRKRLNILNRRVNLRSYLQTLT